MSNLLQFKEDEWVKMSECEPEEMEPVSKAFGISPDLLFGSNGSNDTFTSLLIENIQQGSGERGCS